MDLLPWLEPLPLDPASRRPLLAMTDLAAVPWVGFARDEPGGPVAAELPPNALREEIEAAAVARLARRPARWDVLRARGVTGVPSMLAFEGDSFAAERILDASFLREAEARLGTPIAVAVPRRGVLLARSGTVDDDWDEWEAFVTWVDQLHRGAGDARLSPLVFSAADGEVTGLILRSDSTETTWLREPVGFDPEDPWVSRVMVLDDATGRTSLHVLVGATGIDELRRAVVGAFHRFLPQALADDDFGGELRFVALTEFLPDRPEVHAAVAELQAQLNATIAGSTRSWPVSVRVIVQYGG